MRLFELFAQPYKWQKADRDSYKFSTANGNNYKVLLLDESIRVNDQYRRAYWVEFGLENQGYKYKVERTGDAFNVFATVTDIIKHHLQTADPVDYIWFTADKGEPSRVKLYDAFMKLVPRFLPGWEFYKIDDQDYEKEYIIKRTDADGD